MKNFRNSGFLVAMALVWAGTSFSQTNSQTTGQATGQAAAPAATPMTQGEIRKVDLEGKKVTVRHSEIKHLDMPSMTMVFQMKDPAQFANLKPGDLVLIGVEKLGSGYVVTQVEGRKP